MIIDRYWSEVQAFKKTAADSCRHGGSRLFSRRVRLRVIVPRKPVPIMAAPKSIAHITKKYGGQHSCYAPCSYKLVKNGVAYVMWCGTALHNNVEAVGGCCCGNRTLGCDFRGDLRLKDEIYRLCP